jgi:hypothetical protein
MLERQDGENAKDDDSGAEVEGKAEGEEQTQASEEVEKAVGF